MDKNQIIFVEFFKKWVSEHWRDTQTNLAKFLGVSVGQVSNLLTGQRGGHEITRIKICNKIGVDYRTLIDPGIHPQTKNINTSQAANNVHPFPTKKTSLTPEARHKLLMHEALDAIYESGNKVLISAIESNLVAFRESAETKKRVEGLEKDNKIMSDRIQLLEKVIK